MKSLGLFTEKGHNNAAALLADSNSEISNSVDFICYHDNSLLNIKDRIKVESSSLIEHFNKATLFYDKHINKGHIIDGFYREEIPDIPKEAYREAILNSIIHRDYSRNGSNRIEIFPDRVEITSIGTLPPGISENEFINGTISNVRNQIVADLFLRCHLIERLGTGIRKIKYLFNKSSNQPTFKVFQNSIQIILPKLNITYMLSDSMRSKLESEEDKLLNYIFSLEKVTRPEVEKYMGIKKTKATNLLKVLIDKNFIIKIGNGKSTYYKAK
jgi:ATP-dependent DNA helicase RecG